MEVMNLALHNLTVNYFANCIQQEP